MAFLVKLTLFLFVKSIRLNCKDNSSNNLKALNNREYSIKMSDVPKCRNIDLIGDAKETLNTRLAVSLRKYYFKKLKALNSDVTWVLINEYTKI